LERSTFAILQMIHFAIHFEKIKTLHQ